MKKELSIILLVLLCVNLISAVEYFQTKTILDNNVVRNHIYVLRGEDGTDDYIKDNRPLEVVIDYRSYVTDWNLKNRNYSVDYCNLTIVSLPYGASSNDSSRVVFTKNLSYNYENAKYYMRLNKKDGFMVDMDCKFNKNSIAILDIPADISISTPTNSCKACQYFEWTQQEVSITKAEDIGIKRIVVVEYIKKLFIINYGNILVLFWIFLIMMLVLTFGFIFIGIYGVYLYIEGLIKK